MNRYEFFRLRANLNQNELAEKLAVTQGAVSQWENGLTTPRVELLIKIAKILDCTVDELLGEGKGSITY